MDYEFDAIVVGSGITGGWAAKELTEAGLKVLMIERGREIVHGDYPREMKAPWELPFRGRGDTQRYKRDHAVQMLNRHFTEWTEDHFVNDRENPYELGPDSAFTWFRSYQLGGKSLTWGRQCYRWSDYDFGANARDGMGTDWPIPMPISRRGMTRWSASSAFRGHRRVCPRCPMASFSRLLRSMPLKNQCGTRFPPNGPTAA